MANRGVIRWIVCTAQASQFLFFLPENIPWLKKGMIRIYLWFRSGLHFRNKEEGHETKEQVWLNGQNNDVKIATIVILSPLLRRETNSIDYYQSIYYLSNYKMFFP